MALTKVTGQVIKDTTDVTVGVLTVTNTLAVGGTVSIGGTLTYEDVTNVDAVGLITARNGIVVGSGITLSKDGDIFATGVTTTGSLVSSGAISGTTGTFSDDVNITGTSDLIMNGNNNKLKITSAISNLGILSSTDNDNTFDFFDNDTQTRLRTVDGRFQISADHRNEVADSEIRFIVDNTNQAAIDGNGHLFFRNDSDTYIHRPLSNTLAFDTQGVERFRIESGGNVGIGTTDANNLVHVYGGTFKAQTSTDDTNTDVDLIRAQCGSGGNALFAIRAKDAADDNSIWDIKTNALEDLSFTIGAGSEKVRITSGGNIGIGITNPGSPLQIVDSSDASIRIYDNSGVVGDMSSSGWKFQALAGNLATNANGLQIYYGTTETISVTSGGLVGVNTITPAALMHVSNSYAAPTGGFGGSVYSVISNSGSANNSCGLSINAGNNGVSFIQFGDTDDANVGTIEYNHSDNSMVFDTSASERLRVQDNLVTVTTTNTSGGIKLVDSSTSSGSPNLEIISKRSDSNGNTSFASNIFLGKNRTDDKVSSGIILGSINFGGNHTDGTEDNISYSASIRAAASGSFDSKSDMPTELVFTTTGENESGTDRTGETAGNSNVGTERVRIDSAGQVIHVRQSIGYVYQYKRSSTQLFIVDNLSNESNTRMRIRNPNGTINYNSGSDYRLKENDVEITDGITRLKKLRPIQFKWKTENNTYDGFFAHEVSEACPQAVDGTKDQVATADDVSKGEAKNIGDPIYQSLDHSKMVPLLTAALQESIAKIEVLEAEVAALKSS